MSELIAQWTPLRFWIWVLVLSAAIAGGLWLTFRNLYRARLIEDMPTAKVRSAHQGYVELMGRAQPMDGAPVVAPLTGSDCCWYRYKIEKRSDKSWRTVESESSDSLFFLIDDTGACVIDPEGAEVTPGDRAIWYGGSRRPHDRFPERRRVRQSDPVRFGPISFRVTGFGDRYRYTEERIMPDDTVYALGHFKTLDDLDHQADDDASARQLLREWKSNKDELLRRFDRNKDGEIDLTEWNEAREAASRQAIAEGREQRTGQPTHFLSKPRERGFPYLLSTQEEFAMAKRYRLFSVAGTVLFLVAGSICVWLLKTRFFG